MGIYDRDYERGGGFGGGGFGSGGFGGGGARSANTNLLLTLVAVYVAQLLFEPTLTDLIALPSDWLSRPWRAYGLLTYGFAHSTLGVWHLLGNGIALFFFGRAIEMRYGGREYLAFFGAAVVVGGLAWSLAEMAAAGGAGPGPDTPAGALAELQRTPTLIGASGGVAAVLVLFALNYPNTLVYIWGVLPVPAWILAIGYVLLDLSGAVRGGGNVAYTAHLGGAAFGYLYHRNGWRLTDWLASLGTGGLALPKLGGKPKLRVHREEADPAPTAEEQRVDELLEKIQQQGQASLTAEERRTLERASRRYQQRRR